MAKFKVGDRVKHKSGVTGCIVDSSSVTGNYYVRLDRPAFPGDDCMWPFDERELMPLTPAIPDGWTPVSEPPDNYRDMHVMLNDGEKRFGWYNAEPIQADVDSEWYLYPKGTTQKDIVDGDVEFIDQPAAPGEVIAWREIEPAAAEPKPDAWVRYAIAYKDEVDSCDFEAENCYDTIDRAVDESKKYCRDENKPVEVWKLVAIVNPPAEPEVIRMEE